jgi:hypothetical protein
MADLTIGVSATLQTLLLDRMELPENLTNPVVPVTTGPPPFLVEGSPSAYREQEDARLIVPVLCH